MRLALLLALLVVALVVAFRTIRHRPHQPPPEENEVTSEVAEKTPLPIPPAPHAAPTQAPARDSGGIAHLTGRVLLPAGAKQDTLVVSADDGIRTFEAQVRDGHRYALHLAAGRYTLTASMGALVGVVSDVSAPGGVTREVDIPLSAGAEISGTVQLPTGSGEIGLTVTAAGHDDVVNDAIDEDGTFTVTGLVPGRHYDLVFAGATVRTTTVRDVAAPRTGLTVQLAAVPVLRGAVGFPRGETCPIDSYELVSVAGTVIIAETRQADCTFALNVPEGVAQVTLVARGGGWHLEERVYITAQGDPPAICLNPPCRADPLEGTASIRIVLAGAPPEQEIRGHVETTAHAAGGKSCRGSGECTVAALPVGEPVTVWASGDECGGPRQALVPVAGVNEVRLSCRRLRAVQGIIRGPLPEVVRVHCGGTRRVLSKTRLFELVCPADGQSLEVQVDGEAGSRQVAIPPGDPALVDILL